MAEGKEFELPVLLRDGLQPADLWLLTAHVAGSFGGRRAEFHQNQGHAPSVLQPFAGGSLAIREG
jgi:hypothetical protein